MESSLKEAIQQAAQRLAQHQQQVDAKANLPIEPGDVVLTNIEWLVVREVDDITLLVPIDDHWMVGAADVKLEEPMVARCGHGLWVNSKSLTPSMRCRIIKEEDLSKVRKLLGELARGILSPSSPIDDDPNYWELCDKLDGLREEAETLLT